MQKSRQNYTGGLTDMSYN